MSPEYLACCIFGFSLGVILNLCCTYLRNKQITNLHVKPSNKNICANCECIYLSSLRSLNIKKCTSCGHEMNWNLDPGQLPLVRSNRMVKRDKP